MKHNWGHYWTDEEVAYLRELAPGRTRKEIFRLFREKYDWPGLTESCMVAAMKNRHITSGLDGKFQPGHVSQKKGTSLTKEQYERIKATMFQPGQLPHNTSDIGTEVIRDDGYIAVKVSDVRNIPSYKNWQFKHRLVWEEAHGPIPEDHVILFLDGNRQNCDLDNLVCVPKGVNGCRNARGLASPDPDLNLAGLALAKLIVQRKQREEKHEDDRR